MKYIILILSTFSFSIAFAKPDQSPFDISKFYGNYKFEKCSVKNKAPIWSEDMEHHYVEISNLRNEPFNLDLYRFSEPQSVLNLGLSLEHINQGVKIKRDEDGKKIISRIESFTTARGVYNYQYWNFKDINIGWTSIELTKRSDDRIRYKMKFQYKEDRFVKEEVCDLVKVSNL